MNYSTILTESQIFFQLQNPVPAYIPQAKPWGLGGKIDNLWDAYSYNDENYERGYKPHNQGKSLVYTFKFDIDVFFHPRFDIPNFGHRIV